MTPDNALELVGRYARLTHSITACKKRISAELDKCTGQETHLSIWYSKEYGEWGEFEFERFTVGEGDEEADCPHCYAAHLTVQERKALRKQLSSVKGAMTRSVPAGEGV